MKIMRVGLYVKSSSYLFYLFISLQLDFVVTRCSHSSCPMSVWPGTGMGNRLRAGSNHVAIQVNSTWPSLRG